MQGVYAFLGVGFLGYLLWYILINIFSRIQTLVDEWLIHSMVLSVEWSCVHGLPLYEVSTADFDGSLGLLKV